MGHFLPIHKSCVRACSSRYAQQRLPASYLVSAVGHVFCEWPRNLRHAFCDVKLSDTGPPSKLNWPRTVPTNELTVTDAFTAG